MTTRARRLLSGVTVLATVTALGATTAVVTTQTVAPARAHAIDDGLALTPPMGFNNWNATHCGETFDEEMVIEITDIFVEKGLKDAGYEYVNLDDCWARPQTHPEGSRDADGRLVPDPERFPRGIKWLADYVHSKGLKFGIYTSAGTRTCNDLGFDGALGYEEIDAQTFADWGVDYLKYDNCNNQGVPAIERYTAMREALDATGRDIVFAICEWGQNDPWEWAGDLGHLWRTTGDINDTWGRMVSLVEQNAPLAEYAGPGHWNDPDMLEVGNGGMTDAEYRSHFSLWAIMAAPLLIGSDLRTASRETFDILLNRDVIAVDQDPLGIQGEVLSNEAGRWVFAKPLADGDVAVVLFNENDDGALIETSVDEIGLPGDAPAYELRDLWSKETLETTGRIAAHVPAHSTVMYRVSGADDRPGELAPVTTMELSGLGQTEPGRPTTVTATFRNEGRLPVHDVRLSVDIPDGWSVVPTSATTFPGVSPHRTARATWEVTEPEPTEPHVRWTFSSNAAYEWGPDRTPAETSSSPQSIVRTYPNVAQGAPATQKSRYNATRGGPELAVDGNTDGIWQNGSVTHTAQPEDEAWWQVDLGQSYEIAQIALWNRGDCCTERLSEYYLFVSEQPFTSDSVEETLAQPGVEAYYQGATAGDPTRIPIETNGRYVRVQLTSGTDPLSLAEVEILSPEGEAR